MILFFAIMEGFREIAAHKFRSFLTMLGVILGVSSLLAMFGLTAGMAADIQDRFAEMGGVETIEIVDSSPPEDQQDKAEISPGRTYRDVVALRQSAPLVLHVSPEIRLNGFRLEHGNRSTWPRLYGVEKDYLAVFNHRVEHGRFITDWDVERSNRVLVLGSEVVSELFPGRRTPPLGEKVTIRDEIFTVVGILEEYTTASEQRKKDAGIIQKTLERRERRGDSGRGYKPLSWKNRTAVIPLSTAMNLFRAANVVNGVDQGPNDKIDSLSVKIRDYRNFEPAVEQMKNVLLTTHRGIFDFAFNTREDWFESIERNTQSVKVSGSIIAGIGLLVGGLGITNIMLASIAQRVREIGIRRAVGAKGGHIFLQILIEGTLLAMIGGVLGLLAGIGLIELLLFLFPADINAILDMQSIMISFFFALITGVCAGIYPAWKASRMSPIEALRYE